MRLRGDGVSWRELDGEMVILDLTTSTYLTTNRTGTVLVQLLAEDRSADELAAALVEQFDISVERATADVEAFLYLLHSRNLLDATAVAGA